MSSPATPTTREELLLRHISLEGGRCPVCRYDLAGLRGTSCPECGVALKLSVEPLESRLGRWVTTIAGFAVAGGGSLLLLGAIVWESMRRGWPNRRESFCFIVFPASVALVSASVILVITRRPGRAWFQKLDSGGATAWAVLAVGWPILVTIIFYAWTMSLY